MWWINRGCCYKGTCEKTAVREHPVVMGFGLLTQKSRPRTPQTHMLRGKTCTHTHRFETYKVTCIAVWCCLLSSSFPFLFFSFSFLAQTPPLRPCRWASICLHPPHPPPVSDLLFMSLCVPPSLSVPPLWSRVWVLLGERCATQMMSHHVTLSSPSPSPPLLPLQLSHRREHFLLTRQTQIAHTCRRMVRGAHKRRLFILAHSFPSDRDVKLPLSQTQQAPHQQTCCLVVWRYHLFGIFFFLLFQHTFSLQRAHA